MINFRAALGVSVALGALSLIGGITSSSARMHGKDHAHHATKKTRTSLYRQYVSSNHIIQPVGEVVLSVGRGQLINLAQPITDVFTSNSKVADVNVHSNNQIYLYATGEGEASFYATNKAGQVIYSSTVRVSQNINSLDQMLRTAMPEAQITATSINGMTLLTGTVLEPEDAVQAVQLVNAYLGNDADGKGKVQVISRIKTATPQQVNLQVRIAEVTRSVSKQIGANLQSRDNSNGSATFGIATGRPGAIKIGSVNPTANFPTRDFSTQFGYPAGTLGPLPYNPANPGVPLNPTATSTTYDFAANAAQTILGHWWTILGLDVGAALDLAESDGQATTLAQPNLTALSGETASFLAGGQIPIPIATPSASGSVVTVQYQDYGVKLSFTPTVLADGRISMRVKPEVSEITNDGAVTISGFTIPALTVRRSETTVELGSGQSMVIGGLLRNDSQSTTTKTPGLGDVPVLGAMFRSNSYKRGETELMIVVTPYLVKPVNANQIVLPTDAFKAPTDLQRVLLGKDNNGITGGSRPKPRALEATARATPSVGALEPLPFVPAKPAPAPAPAAPQQVGIVVPPPTLTPKSKHYSDDVLPGFGS